ncbi:uncharacterized protein IAS62_005659 [Cryptococcus decagattii]|uniref:Uncharacterized protein n=1 Tax=Cryptococcus decagattii TaxID=1859122 RepID=A0ABZ2B0G8_9TREE
MTCNCFSEKTASCGSTSKAQAKCTCQKGQCECEACPNSTKISVPGTCGDVKERLSTCGCNGSGEACTCPPGQCACDNCSKKAKNLSTCGCGGSGAACSCPPGKCTCDNCPNQVQEKVNSCTCRGSGSI